MESELRARHQQLEAKVGLYLGYGRGANYDEVAFDAYQQRSITEFVQRGLLAVYSAPVTWSWLKPMASIVLKEGEFTAALPADYAGKDGDVVVSIEGSSAVNWTLAFGKIGYVYSQRAAQPTATGRPVVLAVEPLRGVTHDRGQVSQLTVWPTADQDYTLQFPYYLFPKSTLATMPFVYGGPQFSQLFEDACVAAAELENDGYAGPWAEKFKQSLADAVELDRRNKPGFLGLNTNRERGYSEVRRRLHGVTGGVTVNGEAPG